MLCCAVLTLLPHWLYVCRVFVVQYRVGQELAGRSSVLPLVDDAKLQVVASLNDKDDHVYSVEITDKVQPSTRYVCLCAHVCMGLLAHACLVVP